jgi:hypothetical protein
MNENQFVRKIYWQDIRDRVAQLDVNFARIVDNLNPDKTFPLYLVYYPYGALISDTQSPFIPTAKGVKRLTAPDIDTEMMQHLGYGKDSLPMGMVLEKELEYFIELKEEGITIPWLIYKPGSFFPFTTILGQKSKRSYAPNSVLITTAGVRSTFMLPNIGCISNHTNLQRDFNVQKAAPKSLYEHWPVFKEIVNSKVINSSWRCSVIFFAEKWVQKLYTDQSWLILKSYLLELAWHRFEYDRNRIYYDIAFSVMQKKRNLKPNPYLADTARHLFSIALGCAPGYAPALNEDSLPVQALQTAFLESYNLKKYIPTIMRATNYDFEENKSPVYYSLQHPSTYMFSPKSRKASSTLFEMRELGHIMQIFSEELSDNNTICSDTILSKIAQSVKFLYFHNETDRHQVIHPTTEMAKQDKNLNLIAAMLKENNSIFAEDAKFLRGCVSITNAC